MTTDDFRVGDEAIVTKQITRVDKRVVAKPGTVVKIVGRFPHDVSQRATVVDIEISLPSGAKEKMLDIANPWNCLVLRRSAKPLEDSD